MSDAQATVVGPVALKEANRQFRLCNGCRLCHDFCSVFPAMERRRTFASGDVAFLANLCHDCRACLPICPFKSKHDRSLNVPAIMSEARRETYEAFARPRRVWRLLTSGPSLGVVVALTLAFFALVAIATGDPARIVHAHDEPRSFYRVIGYVWLVAPSSAIAVYALAAILAGVLAFWRHLGGLPRELLDLRAHGRATVDVLGLRNLKGGAHGCHYPGDRLSAVRRRLHLSVFYGFGATFLATIAAAIEQEILGRQPPYALLSAPVILGTLGGLGIVAGCAGFLVLGSRRHDRRKTERARQLDRGFAVTLLAAAVTGLLTLALRSTAAMGTVLILHLGVLGGLFVTFPYGKFVHAAYRYAALVRFHTEAAAEVRSRQDRGAAARRATASASQSAA